MGKVTAFDVASGVEVASPHTGDQDIVAVAISDDEGLELLATGSSQGVVTVWQGSLMQRLARITLDERVDSLWLAGRAIVARTADNRFHVFDLETRGS